MLGYLNENFIDFMFENNKRFIQKFVDIFLR